MEKLTEKRVDEIFKECEWTYIEWCDLKLTEEEAPDVAVLLLPLPNGTNTVAFHPDKLRENKEIISNFLDQIAWLSEKVGVSLVGLGRLSNGSEWTKNIFEIQKLYLLGVVTDQLIALPVNNGTISIVRISSDKSIVSLATMDKEGKTTILEKKIGGKKI